MNPYPYQMKIANKAYEILKENAIVYLAMEERTGKTLVSLLIAEMSLAKTILILTKRKALDGWYKDGLSQDETRGLLSNMIADEIKNSQDARNQYLDLWEKSGVNIANNADWTFVPAVTNSGSGFTLTATRLRGPHGAGTTIILNQDYAWAGTYPYANPGNF